jgi:hypothetical protein
MSFRLVLAYSHKTQVMVKVFKTNVESKNQSEQILKSLKAKFPELNINFDFDDCGKILRVEGKNISAHTIIEFMESNTFRCQSLD